MRIPTVILASASSRRQQLLRQIGVPFQIVPSHVSEDFDPALAPREVARVLAERKARAVAAAHPEAWVTAADTVVTLDGKILGKPASPEDAKHTLHRLSARTHQVITAVAFNCLNRKVLHLLDVSTNVTFGALTESVIEQYIKTGESTDKAGAYAIQGRGAVLVESIEGSYSNVVGLPLYEVATSLRNFLGDQVLFSANQAGNVPD